MKRFFCYMLLVICLMVTKPACSYRAEKIGDYVSLSVTLIPYVKKLIKLSKKNLSLKQFIKQLFNVKMTAYLVIMFLTQKVLWQSGNMFMQQYFLSNTSHFNLMCVYLLFGGIVGTMSMITGLFVSEKINSLFH